MSIRSLTVLLIKLVGLGYLLIHGVSALSSLPFLVWNDSLFNFSHLFQLIGTLALSIGVPIVLILYAEKVVDIIKDLEVQKGDSTLSDSTIIDFGHLKEIHILYAAVIIIGCVVVESAVSNLFYFNQAGFVVLSLLKIVLGVLIFSNARRIAHWLLKQRERD
ncbi:MAG: hypothetical protein HWD92_06975 [Flavobacteriia bacterium]|nr:hypothetical protein [Flavobacteriia bacterium]